MEEFGEIGCILKSLEEKIKTMELGYNFFDEYCRDLVLECNGCHEQIIRYPWDDDYGQLVKINEKNKLSYCEKCSVIPKKCKCQDKDIPPPECVLCDNVMKKQERKKGWGVMCDSCKKNVINYYECRACNYDRCEGCHKLSECVCLKI